MIFSRNNNARLSAVALAAGGLAYPFVVYLALGRVPAGALALVAVALIAARIGVMRGGVLARSLIPVLMVVAVATLCLTLANAQVATLAYPVLMSLGMAAAFGQSLRNGPSLVQVFASLREPAPSPAAQVYMRKVTAVWFVFLIINAVLSAATAASGDLALWTLYNGLISYALMGTLFAVEYAIRRRVQRI
jgi:uncharacterized membrane protein